MSRPKPTSRVIRWLPATATGRWAVALVLITPLSPVFYLVIWRVVTFLMGAGELFESFEVMRAMAVVGLCIQSGVVSVHWAAVVFAKENSMVVGVSTLVMSGFLVYLFGTVSF